MSKYADKIEKILRKEKVVYEKEKSFKDLRGNKYRFDFYIPSKNSIIEVNGEQHYQRVALFHKTRSDFLKGKERDRRKISYCLANGIKIYCLPYWEIEKISKVANIFSDKYKAKDRYKNDEDWRLKI